MDLVAFAGSKDQLDRWIEWKAGSISVLKHYKLDTISKGAHMQRQFTIEVRVDYADADKNAVMKETLQQCARHAYATAVLLNDGVKAQVAIFSDDFFSGHEEIMLLDDKIQQGIDAMGGETAADKPSSEMLAAMRE